LWSQNKYYLLDRSINSRDGLSNLVNMVKDNVFLKNCEATLRVSSQN
jgi:hypothetical protein